jgi:AraC family transcriptional regulator
MVGSSTPTSSWDTIRLSSSVVTIGTFTVFPSDPSFETAGAITHPVFVFPRTSVWIEHEGRSAFVADRTVVTYYNCGQPYRRRKLGSEGDRCDWFRVDPSILREMVRYYDPAAAEKEAGPFPFTYGPSDASSYFLERNVIRHLDQCETPDVLSIEETILDVLWSCLRGAFRHKNHLERGGLEPNRRQRMEVARRLKAILAENFQQPLSLRDLATAVDCSVFHLCRVFRSCVGTTIHRHRSDLRLRAALDLLDNNERDLTRLALDVGFSSHSHFTAAFRRAFGKPPSELKRLSRSDVLRIASAREFTS